jgi:hypothetical protein
MTYASRLLEMGQVAKVHLEKQTTFQQQMLGYLAVLNGQT